MAIGTAGYTAMLAVMALERAGLKPGDGPVIVTGAAGGLGSVAIVLLAKLGYEVAAATGRPGEAAYLQHLGAREVIPRADLTGPVRPLAKERFAGGIDAVGSTTLANVLSMTRYGGTVAACGLAGGMDLPATVAPFILRGVSLAGIELGDGAAGLAPGCLGTARAGPRSRQARRHDRRNRPRRRHRGGPQDPRRPRARPACRPHRLSIFCTNGRQA